MAFLVPSGRAGAHCDTLAGPVAVEAAEALGNGKVEPLLKWVRPQDEKEMKQAFRRALQARDLGSAAREVADLYFTETLVRLHRAGEGEPFTGLKGEEAPLEAGIREADEALEKGSVDALVKGLETEVARVIVGKFKRVLETRKHATESVEKGRRYVAAYVDFLHAVEKLHALLEGQAGHAVPHGHP